MDPSRRIWAGALGLWLVAFAIRVAYVASVIDLPTFDFPEAGDSILYDRVASGEATPPRAYFHSPLYQWFLSGLYRVFGRDLVLVRLLQHALGATGCVLTAALTHRLTRGWTVAAVAGLLCAACGPLVFYEGQLLADALVPVLAIATVMAMVYGAQRPSGRISVVIGVLIGVSALARATALVWLPLAAWAVGRRAGRKRRLLLLALGTVMTIAPVTVRNAVVEGDFVLITANGGLNLYIGNNPRARGAYNLPPGMWFDAGDPTDDYSGRAVATRELGHDPSSSELSSWWTHRAVSFMARNPTRVLALAARKVSLWVDAREFPQLFHYDGYRRASSVLRLLPTAVPILAAGLWGLVVLARRRTSTGLRVVWWAAISYGLAFVPFFVVGRYRAPWLVLIAPLAAIVIARWVGSIRLRHWSSVGKLAIGLGLATAVVVIPRSGRPGPAHQFHMFGQAAAERGWPATAWYAKAVAENPGHVAAVAELTAAQLDAGDLVRAEATITRGLSAKPRAPRLLALRGRLRARQGDRDAAQRDLRAALRIDAAQADAWYALAELLADGGQHDEAARARSSARRLRGDTP